MEDYTNQILRVVVAQVCQAIGWHTIQSTPLELLTDILHKYIQELSVRTLRYTQLCEYNELQRAIKLLCDSEIKYMSKSLHRYPLDSRTDANLDDIGLAFRDLSINIPDLLEYINNVDAVPCVVEVPRYPVKKESSLNFLKPGSKEVITRPVYVHEYLPPVHPEKEEDASNGTEQNTSATKPVSSTSDPSSVITDITNSTVNNANISNNKSLFKKPEINDVSYIYKKPRLNEEEGRPTREISSVMMTSSGFISPAREGKLPDSKTPVIPDYKPVRPVTPPIEPPIVAANTSTSVVRSSSVISTPKPERKSRKQKNSQAGPTVTETKEKRRKERHLAKINKRKNDTETVKPPSRISKIRESRAKHNQETPQESPQLSNILDTLPQVSLPSDLTIKTETVPVSSIYATSSVSASALTISSPSTPAQGPTVCEKKTIVSDDLKLNSELDKQKYSIFKKISKKAREDTHKLSSSLPQNELYSSFPSLPESTTIRRVPAVKFDSPPHTDPNIIVVDDDTPPRVTSPPVITGTPGSQLSMSPLTVGPTATSTFQPPFFENQFMHPRHSSTPMELTKKQQRKPRKNKQQVLSEQSAPLNLSNESTKNAKSMVNNHPQQMPAVKAPRKRSSKVGRPNKRGSAKMMNPSSVPGFPPGMGVPSMISEGMKRDDVSPLNLFKTNSNQFLTGIHRYPLINAFHLLAGPGLIPNPNFMHPSGNPLLPFRNPFGYNDFMGLRPPIRPPKLDETPSTPPPLPLELENNIYCNVPPLVPDSLKLQLSPSLSSRSNKLGGGSTSITSGVSYSSLLNPNTKTESSNLSTFQNPVINMPARKSPKILDAPIEISDDEKNPSDTELEKSASKPCSLVKSRNNVNEKATANSLVETTTTPQQHSPSKDSNYQRANEPVTTVEVNEEEDNEVSNSGGPADTSSQLDDLTLEPSDVNSSSLKSDKKREKEHKKGKRGKDGKIKKKKDKKDKAKNKEKAEKRREEKKEKDRSKKKKEKRKEKGRPQLVSESDDLKPTSTTNDFVPQPDTSLVSSTTSAIPKLTLKFGSPQSVGSDEVQEIRKVNTKSSIDAEENADNVVADERRESSPELARISPLVTRPPKQKASTKEKNSDTEQATSINFPGGSVVPPTGSNVVSTTRGPGRPSKNSANIFVSTSEVQGPSSTGTSSSAVHSTIAASKIDTVTITAEPKATITQSTNERGSTAASASVVASGSNIGLRSSTKVTVAANSTSGSSKQATSEPIDAEGNQVWICPACGRVDDGTPMIGCDGCDAWYHWVCVGIQVPPDEREDWYCRNCIIKKQEANCHDKKKKRKKKNKAI